MKHHLSSNRSSQTLFSTREVFPRKQPENQQVALKVTSLIKDEAEAPLGAEHEERLVHYASALLTVSDVAALLSVPTSWVYDHVRPGCRDSIPHLKLGKYLRFSRIDINQYVEWLRCRRG